MYELKMGLYIYMYSVEKSRQLCKILNLPSTKCVTSGQARRLHVLSIGGSEKVPQNVLEHELLLDALQSNISNTPIDGHCYITESHCHQDCPGHLSFALPDSVTSLFPISVSYSSTLVSLCPTLHS